jgi:predicted TIM-barrel fold metal-dependent hydrolase
MKLITHRSACSLWLVCFTLSASAMRAEEMPVIDCHVHLFDIARTEGVSWIAENDRILRRSFLPADHEPIAKANGVAGAILVQAGEYLPDNQWNLDITAGNKSLYRGVVGNLSLVIGTPEFKPLFEKLCEDPRYLGYRISGRSQEKITEAIYEDLRLTAARGKAVDFLVGSYNLEEISVIAARVPELRIIVNHLGGVTLDGSPLDPAWSENLRTVARNQNVYCKISALFGRVKKQPAPQDIAFYTPVLDLAYDAFGEDRIIFGSDWPLTERTGDYASVLKLTKAYIDSKGRAVSEKLFSKNAINFYRIPEPE